MGQRGADGGVMGQVLARQGGLLAALGQNQEVLLGQGSVLPGTGLTWLADLRQESLRRFLSAGLPSRQDEAWRLANLAPISEEPFALPDNPGRVSLAQAQKALTAWFPARAIFVDGFFCPELSALPKANGVSMMSVLEMLRASPDLLKKPLQDLAQWGHGFSRLGAALFQDGFYLRLDAGASLPEPLQIAFLWSAGQKPRAPSRMSHPLVFIEAGKMSRAAVIEESAALGAPNAGQAPSWRNRSALIDAGEGAQLDYVHIQNGGDFAFETTAARARQARSSRFCSRVLTFGGDLTRNDLDIALEGEGAQCVLEGLYALSGHDRADNHTLVRHVAPRTSSRELYKGIMDDAARAAFRGIIEVAPEAQKTDAMVYNKNLLLSNEGWVNTKPEFRIFANDVQCKHGSTIGRLAQDALFYLRSRGLSVTEARRLLIRAFAQEMINPVLYEDLRAALSRRLGLATQEGN